MGKNFALDSNFFINLSIDKYKKFMNLVYDYKNLRITSWIFAENLKYEQFLNLQKKKKVFYKY